mmetsp:Transcript_37446/g.33555  ORF Transcript_37446/g.33555 Transcript_37446/m.33555 type:complete len:90 (-) Transcript_37446:657-926(-)
MYLTNTPYVSDDDQPFWEETGIFYNYSESNLRKTSYEVDFEALVAQGENPQLFAHFYMNSLRDPESENFTDYMPYLFDYKRIDMISWRK